MAKSIAILIPYFGQWPEWMNFFVESCRANRDIDWYIFGDAEPPENRTPNVHHVQMTLDHYREMLSDALGIRVTAAQPYKLCDLRPALPFVHRDLLRRYEFVGFGDLDVIYGDIRKFYDDDLLSSHDLLSTHPDRVSGHLCLMRNDELMVTAFKRAPAWAKAMARPDNVTFDEGGFYRVFRGRRASVGKWLGAQQPRCLFREAYSTPGPTDRMRWFWKDGRLTNEFYPQNPFMYLHFMSWHSNRWYGFQPGVDPDTPAPWSLLTKVVRTDWNAARRDGFMISPAGIEPIGS